MSRGWQTGPHRNLLVAGGDYRAPTHGWGTSQPQEVAGNFTPARGRAKPPRPLSLAGRPPAPPPPPVLALPAAPSSLPSLPPSPPSPPSPSPPPRPAGGGQVRAGPRLCPQPRAPGRVSPPRPAGGAAEPGPAERAAGADEVGRARSPEQGSGGAGSRPHLETARCAMELGGPGAPPPPPVLLPPLLLLLGAGLLPGKFASAGRTPFRPVQGGLGPREPEEGRLPAAVPAAGARNGAAAEAAHPRGAQAVPQREPSPARKELTHRRWGTGLWVGVRCCFCRWTEKLQLGWREARPFSPPGIYSFCQIPPQTPAHRPLPWARDLGDQRGDLSPWKGPPGSSGSLLPSPGRPLCSRRVSGGNLTPLPASLPEGQEEQAWGSGLE